MKKMNHKSIPVFPNCFVCGKSNPKGLQMDFFLHKKKSEAKFIGDKTHLGYENLVHGGIISAILDDAIIWASYALMGSFGITAELNVRFLKPVHINKEFIIIGEMIEDKGKIWIGKGIMKDKDSNLYAQAKAKVLPLSNIL